MLDNIFYDDHELPNVKIYEIAQKVIKDFMDKEHKSIDYVADLLGTTKGYLYPILNPRRTDKPLSVDRVIEITKITKDKRIIEAICSEFGLIATNHDFKDIQAKDLQELLIEVNIECSDVFRVGMDAIKDRSLSRDEKEALLKEIEEEQRRMEELKQSVLNCSVDDL